MTDDYHPGRGEVLRLAFLCEAGLATLALAGGWLFGQPVWASIGWEIDGLGWGLGACLPMLLLFFLCLRWPVGPMGSIKQFAENIIQPLFGTCTLLDLAVICTLAGFGEEMLFRGLLQPLLASWLGWWPGILMAAVIFGLAHSISLAYVALATLMGLYLSWLWHASDNLLAPIVAHGVYDFLALVWLTRVGASRENSSLPP